MPKIFISYRRDDSAYPAHAIYDTLVAQYDEKSIFFDVDSIPFGLDFHGVLNDAVSQCDVLLAVIGDQWLTLEDETGQRRLDNPDDFVRIEIEAALSRDIPVVPVLVGKALVPRREHLPDSLKALSRRNAAEVRSGTDLKGHLERLVRGIEHVVEVIQQQRELEKTTSRKPTAASSPVTEIVDAPLAAEQPQQPQQREGIRVKPLEIISNSIDMKLALIPAGEFLMGSADSANDIGYLEKQQHQVKLAKPFYLGVYAVTQVEYQQMVGSSNSRFTGGARRPVETVPWFDAVGFCNALSEQEDLPPYYKLDGKTVSILNGSGYRLPTEAEWEYACRAGTTTNWSFGDDETLLREYAWYEANSGKETHPVGEKKPNVWGLHDMHGNVSEWCWDWYGEYEPGEVTDPLGPDNGSQRVLRGGAFNDLSSLVRSACRHGAQPVSLSFYFGFRAARTCL